MEEEIDVSQMLLEHLYESVDSEMIDETDSTEIIEAITTCELPSPVDQLAETYRERIGIRSEFVWKWIYELFPYCTLSCVPDDRFEATRTRKTLFTMFITILDDIAESNHDRATFEQARKIPFESQTVEVEGVDETSVSMAQRVWDSLLDELDDAPRAEEFWNVFTYDVRQATNAVDYSQLLIEEPATATRKGILHYGPHNMVVFPYIDLDLMASPSFDRADLGPLRELLWQIQRLARIGNWVSTWEREIHEGDFSSGVVVWALRDGIVDPDDLRERPDYAVDRIKRSGVERDLIDRWMNLYDELEDSDLAASTVDLDGLLEGMKSVMIYHLVSEGYK